MALEEEEIPQNEAGTDIFPGLADAWDGWLETASEGSEDFLGDTAPFPPLEKVEDYEKWRLVRFDKLVMALFLIAARFALRDQANAISALQRKVVDWLASQGAVAGGKVLVKKIGWRGIPGVGTLGAIVYQFTSIMDEKATQNYLASSIRGRGVTARRDLVKLIFPLPTKRRQTQLVYSRHKTPKQRKRNLSWRPRRKT